MGTRVLSREGECENNTSGLKDLPVMMESVESILDLNQRGFCDDITPYKIAEFKKCTKCAHDIHWDVTFNGG